MNAGQIAGLAWDVVAVYFLLSVISAPFFLLIRAARARGKRLFATEPTERVEALHADTSHEHEWDAL